MMGREQLTVVLVGAFASSRFRGPLEAFDLGTAAFAGASWPCLLLLDFRGREGFAPSDVGDSGRLRFPGTPFALSSTFDGCFLLSAGSET